MTCDRRAVLLCCIGMVFLGLGIAALGFGNSLIIQFIEAQIPLDDPTRKIFRMWQDSAHGGTQILRKIYVYNVTNPAAVLFDHQPPDVSLVGPFVFRERQWNPEEEIFWTPEGSLGYRYHDVFVFAPELSITADGRALSIDDDLTVINSALFALGHRLGRLPNSLLRVASCVLIDLLMPPPDVAVAPTGVFIQRSVRELLFGYDEPLFSALAGKDASYDMPTRFQFMWNGTLPAPSPWTNATGQRCPVWDDQTVCNRTAFKDSFVWAGVDWGEAPPNPPGQPPSSTPRVVQSGLSTVGSLNQWAGNDRMWWWGSPETHGGDCQEFQGGTGMTYPPHMDAEGEPYVYVDSIYRKVKLQYHSQYVFKGIPAKRYVIAQTERDFSANSRCYFQQYVGSFNLEPVVFAPLHVTSILFLDFPADQTLVNPVFRPSGVPPPRALNVTIDGQNISEYGIKRRSEWETYLDVFNDAGILLRGAARLQSNTVLQPILIDGCPGSFAQLLPRKKTDGLNRTYTSYLPETLMPIFFVSREAVLSDEMAEYIRNDVLVFFVVVRVVGGVSIAVAMALLIGAGYHWSRHSPKSTLLVAAEKDGESDDGDRMRLNFFLRQKSGASQAYHEGEEIN